MRNCEFRESGDADPSPAGRRPERLITASVFNQIGSGLFLTNGPIWDIWKNLRSAQCHFLIYQRPMLGLKIFIMAIWGAPLVLTATAGLGCLASRNLRHYLRKHIGM